MTAQRDFWSRRRAAVRAEDEGAALREQAELQERENAEKDDATLLAELGLPDPNTLESGDNIRAFMAKAVPEHLRRMALRRLWQVNPVLANVDGLVEYGEDYTDSATVVENLQSAYQVGKGMLAHVQEMTRQAEASDADPLEEPDAGDTVALEENAPLEDEIAGDATTTPAPEQPDRAETLAEARPRRMRFRFDGAETPETQMAGSI